MTPVPRRWRIIVPLKASTRGKSRIEVPSTQRRVLARAMAYDTVAAAAACGRVLAVVEDEADGTALGDIDGVDVHVTALVGLNESILDGVEWLSRHDPGAAVAVLPGDLPALRTQELAVALAACAAHRFSAVPDHENVGTTLLAATELSALSPYYGPDSFNRHLRAGAVAIDLPATSGLRMDVDTAADLRGTTGPRTAAILPLLTRINRTA